MATHSSVLAWRIPGTGEPGGLPSMGSHRVGHDKETYYAYIYIHLSPLVWISFPLRSSQSTGVEFRCCRVGCRSSSLLYAISGYMCQLQSGGGSLPSLGALSCVC